MTLIDRTLVERLHQRLRDMPSTEGQEQIAEGFAEELAETLVDEPDGAAQTTPQGRLELARRLIQGILPVSQSEYERRLSICLDCPEIRFLIGRGASTVAPGTAPLLQCKVCNCVMNAKARLRSSKCPLGNF
ncbi:hypothetical protein Q0812_11775 [Brevundimonas sp. 2R-24]|uniref:Uncharacterized protein n=1 Tax=Peiella sedimenti TaxID=3061083 RepID=A0ABT8SPM2_9CAUL|nr:hypothetical protein [Caulobacteraceae bacterium XZ-24]